MATNTQGRPARQLPEQEIHYLRKTVNFNDANISSGVLHPFWLPAGAQILFTTVNIITAFNAGTTNVLTVGQNASNYNDIVNATDVNEAVTGSTMVLRGADLDLTTGGVDVQVGFKYTQSGAAATTGKAQIVIAYAPNNDQ